MSTAPNYLKLDLPAGLRRVPVPVVQATEDALKGYGVLVNRADDVEIEIVRWPPQGWRPVDPDSGDEGGTTESGFNCRWRGDVLYGHNAAVGGNYVLGYATEPELASGDHPRTPERLFLWHANYHPDGGQLFVPTVRKPFLVPLAMPGDDVTPGDFVAFHFEGNRGRYIHPNVWHDGVYPLSGRGEFFGRQGAVHARGSVDFAREFGCLLEVTIPA